MGRRSGRRRARGSIFLSFFSRVECVGGVRACVRVMRRGVRDVGHARLGKDAKSART
jgi:hypothetical protein